MKHDMNHDGKIDSRDFALFHEMLNEDQKSHRTQGHSSSYKTNSPSISEVILLLASGLYLSLLLNGVFPINTFTALLTLFNLAGFIRAFCALFL